MPNVSEVPTKVTMIWPPFTADSGEIRNQTVTITVENGDALGVLEVVRADGGMLVPQEGTSVAWFMPWPPAAIKIEPA